MHTTPRLLRAGKRLDRLRATLKHGLNRVSFWNFAGHRPSALLPEPAFDQFLVASLVRVHY
jgi:hypothetical protein